MVYALLGGLVILFVWHRCKRFMLLVLTDIEYRMR